MNKNLIIGGVLVGGGLYYAYKKGLFDKFIKPKLNLEDVNKQSQQTIDEIKQREAADRNAANAAANRAAAYNYATSIDNPNSYAGKVAYIQGQINVNIDGNPTGSKGINSNTNKEFDSLYGLDKGAISYDNIDYYKTRVQNKNTKAAMANTQASINLAAKQKTAANNKTITDANTFINLINTQGMTATLLLTAIAKTHQFDKLTNTFVNMNVDRNFTKGTTFSKGEFAGPYTHNGNKVVAFIERVSYFNPNLNYYFLTTDKFIVQK